VSSSGSNIPAIPEEVAAIRREIERFLNTADDSGRHPCNAKCGVYVFYDYDGEPLYVGQTKEQLRVRIRRHLTNHRTDAVAMNVLDPTEVAEVEAFAFYDLESQATDETAAQYRARINETLTAAEYALYQRVIQRSVTKVIFNEKDIPAQPPFTLPNGVRGRIIPDDIYERRKHPDLRIARRAITVANLARVVSERDVSKGLRRTLVSQIKRLERLASQRLRQSGGSYPVEEPAEETGEDA